MLRLVKDLFAIVSATATAGTAIVSLIPGRPKLKAWIKWFKYTAAGTAHTLTIMKALAATTVRVSSPNGATVLYLVQDPVILAGLSNSSANDYLVVQNPDGTNSIVQVSSIANDSNGPTSPQAVIVTTTANLPQTLSPGAKVWYFSVPGLE